MKTLEQIKRQSDAKTLSFLRKKQIRKRVEETIGWYYVRGYDVVVIDRKSYQDWYSHSKLTLTLSMLQVLNQELIAAGYHTIFTKNKEIYIYLDENEYNKAAEKEIKNVE